MTAEARDVRDKTREAHLVLQTPFLYLAPEIGELLKDLPHLRAGLSDPTQEGTPSVAFPQARKSPRQIYRILTNHHFDHLRRLLESLNFCMGNGYLPPTLVRTRARAAFDSDLAEARVAEHLLRKGFLIEGLDAQKASEPVPEFIARGHELELAVEVYTPRIRLGLDLLMDELQDRIKNLDEPIDFRFEIRVDQLARSDSEQRPLWLHPQILAQALDDGVRSNIVEPLMKVLLEQLKENPTSAVVEKSIDDLNITVGIILTELQSPRSELPSRSGFIHHPPLSGYAPEAIFANLVRRRVSAKLRKAQGPKSEVAPLSFLVIDLAHCSDLTTALGHPWYRDDFEATLKHHLGDLHGYDFVVICEPSRANEPLVAHFLISDEALDDDLQAHIYELLDMGA